MNKFVVCVFVTCMAVTSSHQLHKDHYQHYHHRQGQSGLSDYKDHYTHPKYVYEYGVNDPHTHDIKKQWESRDGDIVKGSYKFVQPDGRIRVVNYYADDKNGFNAEVKFQGKAHHPFVHHQGQLNGHKSQGSFKGSSFGGHVAHSYGSQWKSHHRPCPVRNLLGHQTSSVPTHGHSALKKGYSVGLAGDLDPYVVGFDTQEPHGTSLIFTV